jgi:hypothetical protein
MVTNTELNQVEWNLSQALVAEMQYLLTTANKLFLSGNINKAFWALKAVKFRFIQSLDKKERKKLKDIEKDFYENTKNKNKQAYVYDEYNETLMDYLEIYGYLIPKKKDTHRIS